MKEKKFSCSVTHAAIFSLLIITLCRDKTIQ